MDRQKRAKETKRIPIGELVCITFKKHFKYLGGYISYSLRDDYDVEARIYQAFFYDGCP